MKVQFNLCLSAGNASIPTKVVEQDGLAMTGLPILSVKPSIDEWTGANGNNELNE